jgi:hypothetical protein
MGSSQQMGFPAPGVEGVALPVETLDGPEALGQRLAEIGARRP